MSAVLDPSTPVRPEFRVLGENAALRAEVLALRRELVAALDDVRVLTRLLAVSRWAPPTATRITPTMPPGPIVPAQRRPPEERRDRHLRPARR